VRRKDDHHELGRLTLDHHRRPGPNNPSGFILTTILGIVGAFLATWIGQAIGHYSPDQGAGFITATIGALIVLFIWNRLVARGVVKDYNR
jgi:uncharacterized membrane protein YeaQ/YmgE (transglycosylase-associated protein family)